ncbi:MAG: aminotransferase class IV family protein [Halocynthiibacter sp.]
MESTFCPRDLGSFELFETMRWTPDKGILRRCFHKGRFDKSCGLFGVSADFDAAVSHITGDAPLRLRLAVDAKGHVKCDQVPFHDMGADVVWRIGISETPIASSDPFRAVKTTNRAIYDAARAALSEGIDEMIFLNEHGEVAEGTITNVFIDLEDEMITPPLGAGCLPGVLRAELIRQGVVRVGRVFLSDLKRADQIYVGNSLRGLIPCEMK